MKNNKVRKGVLLTIIISFTLIVINVNAEPIKFKPGVPIPGTIIQGEMDITSSSIGDYINALYIYAARIASLLAIFMLVIAAWQWLFAAGSPEKITNAKSTITGALMGLALLFGGHLLLSQISSSLVELKPIDIQKIEEVAVCTQFEAINENCSEGLFELPGPQDSDGNSTIIKCRGTFCSNPKEACVYTDNDEKIQDCLYNNTTGNISCSCVDICAGVTSCGAYKTAASCRKNLCYSLGNETEWHNVCGTEIGDDDCTELWGINCGNQIGICIDVGEKIPDLEYPDGPKPGYCCNKNNKNWIDECVMRDHKDADNCLN